MVTRLVAQPLDDIMARYGNALGSIGQGKAAKVMGRALNYEGQRTFVQVKRDLRWQSSIPMAMVNRGVRTVKASTKAGSALEFAIVGTGRPLSLKHFGARQFASGTKATVWGVRTTFEGAFMGPRPGVIAGRLNGHVFKRTSPDRLPIERLFGPGIANELVRDKSAQTFYAAAPRILERVGKELAAVLRGF